MQKEDKRVKLDWGKDGLEVAICGIGLRSVAWWLRLTKAATNRVIDQYHRHWNGDD